MEQDAEAEGVSRAEDTLLPPITDSAVGIPIHPSTSSWPSLFSSFSPPLPGANMTDEADAPLSPRPPQSLPSFSPQSYFSLRQLGTSPVPLPELTYHFSRADKDVDDPTASTQRRSSHARSGSSTRTTLNRLFAASSPYSQSYSRQMSFLRSSSPKPSMQSLVSEGLALGTHVYNRGLLEGRHSDICLKLFGRKYRLHRLILEQAPFFASTFSGPWLEAAAAEIELHPEDTDANISKEAFELALKRIYGCRDPQEEIFHCLGLFATACWLEMQELINDCAEIIIRTMQPTNLSPVINLVTSSYYGKAGDLILQSANIMLRREGATISTRSWDNLPADIVKAALSADEFFVTSEWERWCLAKRLFDRRLKLLAALSELDQHSPTSASALRALRRAGRPSARQEPPESPGTSILDEKAMRDWNNLYNHPDIVVFYDLLDHGINYMHLDFEALQRIKAARDIFGVPLISPALISDALWASIELRQKVLSANRQDSQIGLTHPCDGVDEAQRETKEDPPTGPTPDFPTKNNVETSTAAGTEGQEQGEDRKTPKYLIPRCDCNIAIGANPAPIKTSETRKRVRNPLYKTDDATISNFVAPETKATSQPDQLPEPACYSHIPPFRFSVEFPDPRVAEERKSLHSQTFFYAGSFWNIYIQKFRKGSKESKTPQLGVYLRRAEDGRQPNSDIRRLKRFARSVDERIGDLERGMLLSTDQLPVAYETHDATTSQSWDNHSSLMSMYNLRGPTTSPIPIGTRMGLEVDALNSESSAMAGAMFKTESSEDEETLTFTASKHLSTVIPPYVDSRPFVKVYFKIFCPSPGGRSLNIWESVPATFSLKESRGWKSSTLMEDTTPARAHHLGGESLPLSLNLRGDDMRHLANDEDGGLVAEPESDSLANESQLRFSVVVGLV